MVDPSRWTARWLGEAQGQYPARWTLPLRPLAAAFGIGVGLRNRRYDRGVGVFRPPIPVIAVGNLTIGGTNKTPTVDWILDGLADSGTALGVLTRGYGRGGPPQTFRFADLTAGLGGSPAEPGCPGSGPEVGDEPWLLARRHPGVWVAIDPDRRRGLEALVDRGVTAAVADDAFQHRRLARSFDLVLVDATCPWGSGRLLPAGILREPRAGLIRADAVLVTRADEAGEERTAEVLRDVSAWIPRERCHLARLVVDSWRIRPPALTDPAELEVEAPQPPAVPVFVATGIARPESLLHTVRAAGLESRGLRSFRDHARIGGAAFAGVVETARTVGAGAVVCAEKDLPNLPAGPTSLPVWYPRMALVVEREDDLRARMFAALKT